MHEDVRNEFNNLRHWVAAMRDEVDFTLPEIEAALEGKTALPGNCPSKQSLALFVFRRIEEKFSEVEYGVQRSRAAIVQHAGD